MTTVKLTGSEITTLYGLVKDRQIEGSYSGNKEQYYKRIQSLLDKLSEASWKEEMK